MTDPHHEPVQPGERDEQAAAEPAESAGDQHAHDHLPFGDAAGDSNGDAGADGDSSLEDEIDRLREDVDFLLLTQEGRSTRSPILDTSWQAMSSARAREAWHDLILWVDDLLERYALDETIPTCWYAHGAMVEEIHALHQAWLGAYTGRPEPADRAVWHDLLDRVLHRLRYWNRHGCTPGAHRADQPADPTDAQLTERAAHVHQDLRRRERTATGAIDV